MLSLRAQFTQHQLRLLTAREADRCCLLRDYHNPALGTSTRVGVVRVTNSMNGLTRWPAPPHIERSGLGQAGAGPLRALHRDGNGIAIYVADTQIDWRHVGRISPFCAAKMWVR